MQVRHQQGLLARAEERTRIVGDELSPADGDRLRCSFREMEPLRFQLEHADLSPLHGLAHEVFRRLAQHVLGHGAAVDQFLPDLK